MAGRPLKIPNVSLFWDIGAIKAAEHLAPCNQVLMVTLRHARVWSFTLFKLDRGHFRFRLKQNNKERSVRLKRIYFGGVSAFW